MNRLAFKILKLDAKTLVETAIGVIAILPTPICGSDLEATAQIGSQYEQISNPGATRLQRNAVMRVGAVASEQQPLGYDKFTFTLSRVQDLGDQSFYESGRCEVSGQRKFKLYSNQYLASLSFLQNNGRILNFDLDRSGRSKAGFSRKIEIANESQFELSENQWMTFEIYAKHSNEYVWSRAMTGTASYGVQSNPRLKNMLGLGWSRYQDGFMQSGGASFIQSKNIYEISRNSLFKATIGRVIVNRNSEVMFETIGNLAIDTDNVTSKVGISFERKVENNPLQGGLLREESVEGQWRFRQSEESSMALKAKLLRQSPINARFGESVILKSARIQAEFAQKIRNIFGARRDLVFSEKLNADRVIYPTSYRVISAEVSMGASI